MYRYIIEWKKNTQLDLKNNTNNNKKKNKDYGLSY